MLSEDSRLHQNNACIAVATRRERVWTKFVVSWRRFGCTARPQLCLEPCCKGDQLDNSQSQVVNFSHFIPGEPPLSVRGKPQLGFFVTVYDSNYLHQLQSPFVMV